MSQLLIEKENGIWEPFRSIYSSFDVKFKFQLVGDSMQTKGVKMNVKKAQFSKFTVLKGTEVMEDENNIIEAAMNFQMAMMKDQYGKGQVIPLKNFTSFFEPGMACQGIQISDIDMSFGPSQVFLSSFYRDISPPDTAFCAKFKQFLDIFHAVVNEFYLAVEDVKSLTEFFT